MHLNENDAPATTVANVQSLTTSPEGSVFTKKAIKYKEQNIKDGTPKVMKVSFKEWIAK